MEKLKLFRIYDIVHDEDDNRLVVSAKKEFVADLETLENAVSYSNGNEVLYIMSFNESDELSGIVGVVHCGFEIDESCDLYEEYGSYVPPYIDCAEWDYRVYAGVAFDVDLSRGKIQVKG